MLKKLQKANLVVKPEKCSFYIQKVHFLGFVISPGKIEIEEDKVKAILEWPEPRNVKETQLFLGLANYYRKFIKGYSKIAELLTNLTKKDLVFY